MKSMKREFGVVITGSEILSGKRSDLHMPQVIKTLAARGQVVSWCRTVADEKKLLVQTLRETQRDGTPVFCFGGIGATPDDLTREAAAAAFNIRLARDAEAAKLIESEFGEEAYPERIRMADIPEDSTLIPNPVNQVPGFSLVTHHFLPGFPQMAWPMLDWVLDSYYPPLSDRYEECSVCVLDARECDLIEMMEELVHLHVSADLFCLPRLGRKKCVEVGFRGNRAVIEPAFRDLQAGLSQRSLEFEILST